MRQVIQGTNVIVLVGAWNIAIFTPEWVKEHLLPEGGFKIFYPSMVGCSLKFQTKSFAFCIEGNRLQFEVIVPESRSEAYVEIIRLLRVILRKLPYTPISAMGTNYVFDYDKTFEVFNTLGDKEPLENIVNLLGTGVKSQALVSKFDLGEKEELTIRLDAPTQGQKRIDFNFNYAVKSANNVIKILGDEDLLLNKNEELAIKIVHDLYGE